MVLVKRVVLFVLTNLAVLVLLGTVMRLLGLDGLLGGHAELLGLAAVVGFVGSFVSLALSKWTAKALTGARVITGSEGALDGWLVDTVAAQAACAGVGMPEVAIYESSEPNAFATGMWRDHALVAVSSGLLDRLSRREVEAVLAHEVSHVANGDMVTLALLQGVVNTFVVFLARVVGQAVDRALAPADEDEAEVLGVAYWMTTLVCEVVFGALATMIVLWFSRRRELRADAGAARLAGVAPMIAALERLRDTAAATDLPSALAAFGIREGTTGLLGRLFMSHPPIEERIAALERLGERQRAPRVGLRDEVWAS